MKCGCTTYGLPPRNRQNLVLLKFPQSPWRPCPVEKRVRAPFAADQAPPQVVDLVALPASPGRSVADPCDRELGAVEESFQALDDGSVTENMTESASSSTTRRQADVGSTAGAAQMYRLNPVASTNNATTKRRAVGATHHRDSGNEDLGPLHLRPVIDLSRCRAWRPRARALLRDRVGRRLQRPAQLERPPCHLPSHASQA